MPHRNASSTVSKDTCRSQTEYLQTDAQISTLDKILRFEVTDAPCK
ncbi:hypothetical protein TcasGA2_TC010341 [Tribolium castaneum]|uniref:Uncharacterized protein n=1 Tax=Tribolium castaneum TaxID=7070 RepID=D6WGC6_TRICA|nr:hypothetical protein TcasGA2_TC010341 [Tribolium castaneum]